jgi:ribosomal protein S18 acetylase RimI-like enzyme
LRDRVEDLLWWEGERLLGFPGLYPFGSAVELAGMVAPAARRLPLISRVLNRNFGPGGPDVESGLDSPRERTLVVEWDGSPVGTMRLTRDAPGAGIYTFAIDPARRGRGLGREALRQACELLRGEGVERVGLEVDLENDRALALYTSIGFTPVATEDYFSLPMS